MHFRPVLVSLAAALVLPAMPAPAQGQQAAAAFDTLVTRHIDARARRDPEWATDVGLHTADHRLTDRSAAAERADSLAIDAERRVLLAIDTTGLDPQRRIDWLLFESVLATSLADAGLRNWNRRPGAYIPFGAVYGLAVGTEPGPRERMASLTSRLEAWPAALALGRAQVVPARTPAFWVDLDVGTARRITAYLRDELPAIVARSEGDTVRFARARDRAVAALSAYTSWMADTLRPAASGSWQLGRDAYDWRLRRSKMLDRDAEQMIAFGFDVLHETQGQLASLARTIDPSRTWRQLADSAKTLHPPADSIFPAYAAEAERARRFIIDRKLFMVPPGERLEMVLTPPNLRQTYAYGGYSAAAPFEKEQVGRFFVTPVEEGWTPEQVQSKLRGHNYGWITVVALHEGYPGHHLQYVRAAQQPSMLRKIYGSEVFGEGWGLYAEELMYRSGFYPDSLARLTQLRMRLWRAARVIIDPSIHTGRMTFDEAVAFFVDTVGLERADAVAEVTRYTTWPTQAVSYIVGMQAVEALRDEVRARQGASFDLARFHDVLLRQGSLPPPLMRRAVLDAMRPVRVDSLAVRWTPEQPVQGSLVRLRVTPMDSTGAPLRVDPAALRLTGTLADEPLHFEADGDSGFVAYAGLPVTASELTPVALRAEVAGAEARADTVRIPVGPGNFRMEKLTVAPRYGRAPDSALAARMARESAMARAVSRASHDTPRLWEPPFVRPRPGRITSGFGNGREFNGVVQSRHTGTDFAGAIGTPVRAANRGVVALVADFHLAGNAIYIDHGAGLVTGYFHLSRTDVAQGDTVSRGQVIGRVGATGRVTGPHLHWIARYGTVSVNPVSLFEFGEVKPGDQ